MTSGAAYPGDDPRQLLSSARELASRVRQTQRATWLPLLVLAAVTFAAIPAYHAGHHVGSCVSVRGGRICISYYPAAFVYWPIALVLAYTAIAAFYIRRSRARGVGTRVRPYVTAGIVLALVMSGVSLAAVHHPPPYGQGLQVAVLARLISPASAIGLALLVLARTERSRALVVLALAYLVVVLVPVSFGWVIDEPAWFFVPRQVIDGSVLLLASIGFALAQRPWRQAA
ncbi:MAG TPA: hypothetical protein VGG35_15995 [Streptosporangiaceae bacterium]|jgi:hypothetical protein